MKDLKHYFSSPKQNNDSSISVESPLLVVSTNPVIEGVILNETDGTPEGKNWKRKKRKSKVIEEFSECNAETCTEGSFDSLEKKKVKRRKKSLETTPVTTNPFTLSRKVSLPDVEPVLVPDCSLNSAESPERLEEIKTNNKKRSLSTKKKKKVEGKDPNATPIQDKKVCERKKEVPCATEGIIRKGGSTKVSRIPDSSVTITDYNLENIRNFENTSTPTIEKPRKCVPQKDIEVKFESETLQIQGEERQLESIDSAINGATHSDEAISILTPKNKILNYFSKVDKLPSMPERPKTFKVTAIVHSPPSISPKPCPPRLKRKTKNSKTVIKDFDAITSEEDNSIIETIHPENKTPTRTPWKMRVKLSVSEEEELEMDSQVEEKDKSVARLKCNKVSEEENSILNSVNQKERIPEETRDKEPEINDSEIQVLDEALAKHVCNGVEGKKQLTLSSKPEETENREGSPAEFEDVLELNLSSSPEPPILVEDDDSIEETPVKPILPKKDGTLASYFIIKGAASKSVPPEMTKEQRVARRQFLQSGVPESMKKTLETKSSEEDGRPAPFPRPSHVTQKDPMSVLWNLPQVPVLLLDGRRHSSPPSGLREWTTFLEKTPARNYNESFSVVSSVKKAVKDLKKKLEGYPIGDWYKAMKEMKSSRGKGEIWTDKYRPITSDQFIANRKNIQKLKTWLENHKADRAEKEESSGDEFVRSEEEEARMENTALLLGPNGAGKTAAVYTIANELGYQVLELNAASNRSGKRILHEFLEATQSHKVKTNCDLFGKVKKKKKVKGETNKRSLILVEDADVAFQEHDEGFVSAIGSLASSSKRPLVLVANDENCKHLAKLASRCQLSLHFTPPNLLRLSHWLKTVGLCEGVLLDDFSSSSLAAVSRGDVRRCLLQMQLSASSTHSTTFSGLGSELWTLTEAWRAGGESRLGDREENEYARTLLKAATTLDALSQTIRTKFSSSRQPSETYWWSEGKDSTSLEESLVSPDTLSSVIFEELLRRTKQTFEVQSDPLAADRPPLRDASSLGKTLAGVEAGIGDVALLSRGAIALDYLPTLRAIARRETVRLATQTKRNNRFLNYLQTVGITASSSLLKALSEAFPPFEGTSSEPPHSDSARFDVASANL